MQRLEEATLTGTGRAAHDLELKGLGQGSEIFNNAPPVGFIAAVQACDFPADFA